MVNVSAVRFFGEFEFWLSSAKVTIICGVIILTFIIALGGGPDHDRRGFRYYHDPGAFKPYVKEGSAGNFLGFWSSMITAVFAYLGKLCLRPSGLLHLAESNFSEFEQELNWSV